MSDQIHHGPKNMERSLVIFASREAEAVVERTLRLALLSIESVQTSWTVHIIVNGNKGLGDGLARRMDGMKSTPSRVKVQIWSLSLGDKAHAWNTYIQRIWNGEQIAYFIDGYVRLREKSLVELDAVMRRHPNCLGGTGVPSVGPSAHSMRAEIVKRGGYHGNLCCMRGNVIAEMRNRKICIPVGMYRVDSLVGAYLSYALDPTRNKWDEKGIAVAENASWDVDVKRWWRYSDLKAKRNQILRQAKGALENAAVKFLLTKAGRNFECLPSDVYALLHEWLLADPGGWKSVCVRNPIALYQLYKCMQWGAPIYVGRDDEISPIWGGGCKR